MVKGCCGCCLVDCCPDCCDKGPCACCVQKCCCSEGQANRNHPDTCCCGLCSNKCCSCCDHENCRRKCCVCMCCGDNCVCDPCALCCGEYKGDIRVLENELLRAKGKGAPESEEMEK
ncbi:hypothetical protein BASA81_001022 [Batrachochytrium salamandrivorans]|nr:hypothetical protein BASA81_001022 [Batrachochytrium salamandrivorans]